jgi:hypothetical protein
MIELVQGITCIAKLKGGEMAFSQQKPTLYGSKYQDIRERSISQWI